MPSAPRTVRRRSRPTRSSTDGRRIDAMKKLNRRDFVRATTAAGVAAAAMPKTLFGQAPTVITPKSVKPVVVASGNGNTSKDADNVTCVAKAFGMMTKGSDVLDALV